VNNKFTHLICTGWFYSHTEASVPCHNIFKVLDKVLNCVYVDVVNILQFLVTIFPNILSSLMGKIYYFVILLHTSFLTFCALLRKLP